MRYSFFIVFLFVSCNLFSQEVQVLDKSDRPFKRIKNRSEFCFIHETTDIRKLEFVATIEAKYSDRYIGLEDLYLAIAQKAKKMGANSFTPHSYKRSDSTNAISLILDVYYASDEMLSLNRTGKDLNTLYVFAGEKNDQSAYQRVMINNRELDLEGGTYFKYTLDKGEMIIVKKPGFESLAKKIIGAADHAPTFLMLWGGFAVSDYKPVNINTTLSGGYINLLDENFGELMKEIFLPVD